MALAQASIGLCIEMGVTSSLPGLAARGTLTQPRETRCKNLPKADALTFGCSRLSTRRVSEASIFRLSSGSRGQQSCGVSADGDTLVGDSDLFRWRYWGGRGRERGRGGWRDGGMEGGEVTTSYYIPDPSISKSFLQRFAVQKGSEEGEN